jgi:L-ascorbate metabolism protein UlaG (beta-lactamase superfamily)
MPPTLLGHRALPFVLALLAGCAHDATPKAGQPTITAGGLPAITAAAASTTVAGGAASGAPAGQVHVQWLGQAAFRIVSPGGKVIVIDPWLATNPRTPPELKTPQGLGKVDVLLVTHGHFDHIADAPAIAAHNKIPMYAPGDLNQALTQIGVLPEAQLPRANKGGRIDVAPGIRVTMTRAEHSSVYVWRNPATGRNETHPGGEAVGYLIELENGFRIWHMGDTGLFGDMRFVAEYYRPDLVLIPIGGRFTMDPVDAAHALRQWIRPRFAIPMHYGANPLARGTPEELVEALGAAAATRVLPIRPGDSVSF